MAFHPKLIHVGLYDQTFSGPLQAIHLRAGSETKVVAAFSKLISHIHRPVYVALSAPCICQVIRKMLPVTVYSNKIKTWWNCPERAFRLAYWVRCRNGVLALREVLERRTGSFRLKLSTARRPVGTNCCASGLKVKAPQNLLKVLGVRRPIKSWEQCACNVTTLSSHWSPF